MNIDDYFQPDHISDWAGLPGKRNEFVLTVTGKTLLDQGFALELVRFKDEEGNVFIWWSSKVNENLDVGATYRIRATVKRHSQFREEKQTVITMPKVIGPYLAPVERDATELVEGASVAEIWNAL